MDTVYLKVICWHKQLELLWVCLLVRAPRVHSAHSLQRAHAHQHMLVSCFFRPLKWTDANEPWTEAPHIRGSVGKRRSYKEREREREGWINAHKSPFWLAGWMATFGRRRKGGRGEEEREREGKWTWEQSWWRHMLNRFTLIHFWCLAFRAAKLTLTSPHLSHSSLLSFSLHSPLLLLLFFNLPVAACFNCCWKLSIWIERTRG